MEVIMRGNMPDGTKIQIEDWNRDFPDLCAKNATIGFYPMCTKSIKKDSSLKAYPEKGKTFRASFNFSNSEAARVAFVLLYEGKKNIMDYLDNYGGSTVTKEDFILALS